jgi:2-iminobutanoate/2-iminopropanoate deaminase
MTKKVETINAPKAVGPYSQAIIFNDLVFTAGQIYLKPDGELNEGLKEDQIRQIMENLKAVLEEAGSAFSKVLKTTIYLTDMTQYPLVNQIYGEYLSEPFPARETVGVKELPKGVWIEISMVASK